MASTDATRRWMAVVVVTLMVAGMVLIGAGGSAYAGGLPPGGTFTDDDGNTHEGYIEAIAAAGVTQGCNADGTLYCPSDLVTRGQMATFLARALGLPDATGDHFTDDDGTTHEDSINKIFEAGITSGFADGTYQPDGFVRRDQMASFLSRGLNLGASTSDYFGDDDGNTHEGAINSVAEAGISLGCDGTGTIYCPTDNVRRDQMASFLGRGLGLSPVDVPPPTTTTTVTVNPNYIEVFNLGFSPSEKVIDGLAGSVTFEVTSGTHAIVGGTPSAPRSDLIDSGTMSVGDRHSTGILIVSGATTVDYYCSLHPSSMQGTIRFETP